METGTATAEYFATISNGKIVTLGHAIPPQVLLDCQTELTKQEYNILSVLDVRLEEAVKVILAVQAKIKANGS